MPIDITSGDWVATTTGDFISFLIDSGHDPVVIFRVDEDERTDDTGTFIRKITLYSVPNGKVKETLSQLGFTAERGAVYKVLKEFLRREIIT